MSPNVKARRRKKSTFIEQARRKQIVGATIETIARQGLQHASLTEIARALDISQSVISYHFDGKSELIAETINSIFEQTNVYIKTQVDAQASFVDKLYAYIDASFEFELSHRDLFVALVDLLGSFGSVEEKRRFGITAYDACRRHLEKILLEGQEHGEFHALPAQALATMIQGAIDGIMLQWVFNADAVDMDECRLQMKQIFGNHVRKETTDGDTPV